MNTKIRRIPLKERLRRVGRCRPGDSVGRCSLRRIMDAPISAYLGSAEEENRLCRMLPQPPGEGKHLSYRDAASQVCRMWGTPGGKRQAAKILDILADPAAEYARKGGNANG